MKPLQYIHDMNDLKGVNLNRRIKLEKKRHSIISLQMFKHGDTQAVKIERLTSD